jgi:hypothetical protein
MWQHVKFHTGNEKFRAIFPTAFLFQNLPLFAKAYIFNKSSRKKRCRGLAANLRNER